jgi:uncharacterized phiE125 gp8 family phage protein
MKTNSTLQYGIEVITPPSAEPLSLADALVYLREDADFSNADELEAIITVARTWVEEFLRRPLLPTGFTLYLDDFGGDFTQIVLPRPSVSAVSAIRYIDEQGEDKVLATTLYRVDIKTFLPRITPANDESWPCLDNVINAVEIDFTAGYANVASIPTPIIHAIKMLVSHWYDNREVVTFGSAAMPMPMAVERLLGHYRVRG